MRKLYADSCLLLVTIIWGAAFVAQRIGAEHVGTFTFNGLRFSLGGILVWFYFRLSFSGHEQRLQHVKSAPYDGYILGGILFLAALFQQVGVPLTSTANCSFLTVLNVIFVPAFSVFIGHAPRRLEIVGSLLAIVGAYYMSVSDTFIIQTGDYWVFASACFWALHILYITIAAARGNTVQLAYQQFLTCAALSLCGAVFFETLSFEQVKSALPAILFAGGVSIAIAYTLQVVVQQHVSPSHAVIILSLEGVFGAISGWLYFDEVMSMRAIFGAGLLTVGVIVAQSSGWGSSIEGSDRS